MKLASALIATAMLFSASSIAIAQQNRIDTIRPDAPELAAYGDTKVGVRTIEMTNPDQIDIVNIPEDADSEDLPRYDRKLTVEVWYPAAEDAQAQDGPDYTGVLLRDGKTEVDLYGKAIRDAEPAQIETALPLLIISHGYPGNRFLLSHLGENLASKGYVVASIDHPDSTYDDQTRFGSTLVNRPLDQLFVLNEMDRLSKDGDSFLNGLADASTTGLIGYSMGGYGAVITAGGGVTQAATEFTWGAPAGTLGIHLAGSQTHKEMFDDRIKAVVAIAPWGMERGFWDADGLAGVHIPILYVAGSQDDVAGYEKGVKAIFEGTTNVESYLLTFDNANHNAAAPMPAPAESYNAVESLDFIPFEHYADAVWDTTRMNNILQHFSTAFLAEHLKGEEEMGDYLDLVENANDGVYAVNEDGTEKPEHTYWKGFADRTAKGLTLMQGAANETE